jgi:hypothetical protein
MQNRHSKRRDAAEQVAKPAGIVSRLSHVDRVTGTQRVFLKRLNRLTLCFSKKLRNLECAFAMFAAFYNYCWQTRKPGKRGQKRGTAAMMAGPAGHVWSFNALFDAALSR